jgi:hypothetical protein
MNTKSESSSEDLLENLNVDKVSFNSNELSLIRSYLRHGDFTEIARRLEKTRSHVSHVFSGRLHDLDVIKEALTIAKANNEEIMVLKSDLQQLK